MGVCVCARVVGMHGHMRACVHGSQRSALSAVPREPSTLFSEMWSFLGTYGSVRRGGPVSSRALPITASPALVLEDQVVCV